jgi:hypothetical protein
MWRGLIPNPMKKHHTKTSNSSAGSAVGSQPLFHRTLVSARQGVLVDSWSLNHKNAPLGTKAAWSISIRTLHGGKQEGVSVIEVDNGRLRFVVVPTRGMSVLKVEAGDVRLGWDSPVKEVVHPKFINLESRGGLGWLEGFNEWLVRCGLESAGQPGQDKFRNNVGDEVDMSVTLHGKVGNIPASEVEVVIDSAPPHRIHVRGLVEERMFYGPKLSLWADISTEPGSSSFRIEDAVQNHGAHDQEFQIIYHANFGAPLLGAGARFVGPIEQVTPFNDHAARSVKNYGEYAGPQPGFVEQVYCLRPLAGPDGRTELLLQNARGDRGVSVAFPVAQLPYATLWKNLAAEAEGYVTGIEPGTGFPNTRRVERKAGRVPKLAPNETRRFTIDVEIHRNRSSTKGAEQRIQGLQGNVKPRIAGSQPEIPIPKL